MFFMNLSISFWSLSTLGGIALLICVTWLRDFISSKILCIILNKTTNRQQTKYFQQTNLNNINNKQIIFTKVRKCCVAAEAVRHKEIKWLLSQICLKKYFLKSKVTLLAVICTFKSSKLGSIKNKSSLSKVCFVTCTVQRQRQEKVSNALCSC